MIITVVGLGVVGGSYVKALKGLGYDVYGIDINEQALKLAKEEGCIIEGYTDGKEIIPQTDLTIISLYPSLIEEFIEKNHFKAGSIITDAVGVKSYFVDKITEKLPENVEFLSGHPMAGREKKGYLYASKDVFQGANYILTPHSKNTKEAIIILEKLVYQLGFKSVKIVTPAQHDEIIAFTSQLPHVLAVSLINSDQQKFDTGKFIGDSYRDLTRIANINENLWTELFFKNKENLLDCIEHFETELHKLKEAIKNEDEMTLKELFIQSSVRRENLEKKEEALTKK